MSEVAILVPTLGRPHALGPLLESIEQNTPEGVYSVVFVVDHDDAETYREIVRLNRPYVQVLVENGTYPHKINVAAAETTEPWVFLTADDVVFHPGWWEATECYRIDPVDVSNFQGDRETIGYGVIGTNDLHNRHVQRGEYATQFLVARWYIDQHGTIDEPGKVFHEGYHHNCIDVELSETAMARGVWALCLDSVVEHIHHLYGGREADDTDRKGNLRNRDRDKALLAERRKLWA